MSGVGSQRRVMTCAADRVVKYSPCVTTDGDDEEEGGDCISIVSDTAHDTASLTCALSENGPNVIPGTNPGYNSPTKVVGQRLGGSNESNHRRMSPVYDFKKLPCFPTPESTSQRSLYDYVKPEGIKPIASQSDDSLLMTKIRSSEAVTPRGVRKQRRKEIDSKFRNSRKSFMDVFETSTTSTDKTGCKWTFVFDPSGRLIYWWSSVVSIAFLYNFWVIIYRFAFQEINTNNMVIWFSLDYTFDLIYVFDIAFHFRTGFLEEGVLQTDSMKLRFHYMNSTVFYADCLCLLPLDFLYLSVGFRSIVRAFRLVKVYRFWAFLDRTERHTNYPNVIRTLSLMHYLMSLFHWNACVLYMIGEHTGAWGFPKDKDVTKIYLHALYWSITCLTNVGGLPDPTSVQDYLVLIFELIFGLLLFATALGHVASIVASVGAARKEFQARLDSVKTYMSLRGVPLKLQDRVIKWFDYLWVTNKSADEERMLKLLPDKLKAEIAIHVHLDTLQRVEIFQNTESGFLCELVLRLKPVLFSPGDYICRKGEIGKDMYIVNRGCLHVVADRGRTMLATLKAGSYFGEISILNMGTAGNRRTASVRSVGYSDLFRLAKQDLWDVLKEYPAARVKLEAIAVKRLQRYKKAPIEKIMMSRSKSTPGLVESTGKTPIVYNRHTITASQALVPPPEHYRRHPSKLASSEPNLHYRIATPLRCASIAGVSSTTHETPTYMQDTRTRDHRRDSAGVPEHTELLSPTTNAMAVSTSFVPTPSPIHIPMVSLSPGLQATLEQQQQQLHYSYYAPSYHSPSPQSFLGSPSIPSHVISSNHLMPPSPSHMIRMLHPVNALQNMYTPAISQTANNVFTPLGGASPVDGISSPVPSYSSTTQHDLANDLLLQEISRLRERLATLESENASMSVKLNQQQWEVDSRLTEIEMHMCGSESDMTSAEAKRHSFDTQNKESVI